MKLSFQGKVKIHNTVILYIHVVSMNVMNDISVVVARAESGVFPVLSY
jgi:hypothetical protein